MGQITCYVGCKAEDYENLKDDGFFDEGGLTDLVDRDALYDWLDGTPEGVEYVDGEEYDPIPENDEDEWLFSNRECLEIESVDEFSWKISWKSAEAKLKWFDEAHRNYTETLKTLLEQDTLENFSEFTLRDPPYQLNFAYHRRFGGRVMLLDEDGRMSELDYPMELLRLLEPPEGDDSKCKGFIISKKGIPYK